MLFGDQTGERPMHHKRDWTKYNKELVNRGKINFWVSRKVFRRWKVRGKKNGRPFVYSDELIKSMSYIRFKFHLSLRETEGFFRSLIGFLRSSSKVPSYTQFCRRLKTLKLPAKLLQRKGVTDIVLDTTGLKVFGAGEWRAEKYGGKKQWKKLHLAMDIKTGKLLLAEVTDEHVHDTTYLEKALKRCNRRQGRVLIDGIADSGKCYSIARKYKKKLITPPKRGAVFRVEPEYDDRNEALRIIKGLGGDDIGRGIWAKLVGYSRRVVVESMVAKWKKLHGPELKSRCEMRRKAEVQLKAEMINKMANNIAA